MKATPLRCAFLSTHQLDGFVVDDARAHAALARRRVEVTEIDWHDRATDWSAFDLVIVRSTWDYHKQVAAFLRLLESIDASPALLANPLAAMRWNARKTYLADLRDRGVNIVPTEFGEGLDDAALAALAGRFGDGEWIIKPDVGANADGVVRLTGPPDRRQARHLLERFGQTGFLAQPFVHDITRRGEYSLFYFDGRLSHCILKTPAAGDYRVQEEHGGRISALSPPPALQAAADRVCAALPRDCLYVRIDLVTADSGRFAVMEVELIEPSLYLRMHDDAPDAFAAAVVAWFSRQVRKKRGQTEV